MKILIGADTYAPDINGASTFAQRLATGLLNHPGAARPHEVHVVCPSTTTRLRTAEVEVVDGVHVHRVPSVPLGIGTTGLRISPQPWLRRQVQEIVDGAAPDVVHVQGHFFIGRALLAAARRADVHTVATNHFMPENLTHYVPGGAALRRRIHRWAWRDAARVLNRADVVTTPTPYAADLAVTNGVHRPVQAISCGMDLDRFSGADGRGFRRRHGLGAQPTFGYVGRLAREKNVDELVRALAVLRYRFDARLLLVGDGDEAERLRALARHLGVEDAVTMTGFVSEAELPSAYAAMDVFVNAGTAELQSLVTLEAMASGLPVLGVDAGALPHLVHDGENGNLFPHGHPARLAALLDPVLRNPLLRTRYGLASRQLAGTHDLNDTLAAFTRIYGDLVGQNVLSRTTPVLAA